jgi:hypothetical protein
MSFETLTNPVVLLDLFDLTSNAPIEESMDDLRADLESFDYDEDRKQVGELTLTFNNPAGIYDDDERFSGRDKALRVRWGYLNHLSPIKTCIIVSVTPRYPADGVCKLEVKAWDAVSRAFLSSHPRNWGQVSTTYIARELAARWNLIAVVPQEDEDVRTKDYVQPGKLSDLNYLKFLAQRKGWESWSDGVHLYFGPDRNDEAPELSAVYGAGRFPDYAGGAPVVMTSFTPTLKQAKRPTTRHVAIDPQRKETSTHKADDASVSADDPTRKELGRVAVVSFADHAVDFKNVPEPEADAGAGLVKPTAEPKKEQVAKDTAAEHWKIKRTAAEASATFIGTCELRVGRIIDIQGVAETHSGKWKITKTRHQIQVQSTVYGVSVGMHRAGKSKGTEANKNPNIKPAEAGQEDAVETTRYNVSFEKRTVSSEKVRNP